MCGCYASFQPAEAMARIFGTVNLLPNQAPSWNVALAQDTGVVRYHPATGARHLDLLTWGLLPYWTKEPSKARRPINARSETAATSSMFKDALARRRCRLVPADAFYEWKVIEGGKQPYAIAREDGQPMAFAGLWESFRWPEDRRAAFHSRHQPTWSGPFPVS
jgi:putative SOS response-associated peptidase YedK